MDYLGWAGLLAAVIFIPIVGFGLALRQDEIRWRREKRAELYIDLLAEAHAEKQWVLKQLTGRELAEIRAQHEGADHDDDDDRWPALPDTRLDPAARALLGARMSAFASAEVSRRFNAINQALSLVPRPGESTAAKWAAESAFEELEKRVRHELGESAWRQRFMNR